jgi:hypothetical protein
MQNNLIKKKGFMKTTMMKTLFWGWMLLCLSAVQLHAQVTIGSNIEPLGGALLDLKQTTPATDNSTSTKGLLLPRVELSDLNKLYPMFATVYGAAEDAKHTGLTVYNLTQCDGKFARGVYTWTGEEWVQLTNNPVLTGSAPDPSTISPSGETAVTAATGSDFTLGPVSVSFLSGTPATAYRWYRNTSKSTGGATLLPGKTSCRTARAAGLPPQRAAG